MDGYEFIYDDWSNDPGYWDPSYWEPAVGVEEPQANNIDDQAQNPGITDDDLNWIDLGDGSWLNEQTGEWQDEYGNTIGFLQPNGGGDQNGDPLFSDPDTGLQTRDDSVNTTDIIRPIDIDTSGGGFLGSIGNFFSNLFGSTSDPARPSSGGGGGGGTSLGSGGQSGSQQQQQNQQYQQALQQLQQQLAAAQRANASSNVTDAISHQIATLQGGSMGSLTQTLLIAGGVGVVVYLFANRKPRAA